MNNPTNCGCSDYNESFGIYMCMHTLTPCVLYKGNECRFKNENELAETMKRFFRNEGEVKE